MKEETNKATNKATLVGKGDRRPLRMPAMTQVGDKWTGVIRLTEQASAILEVLQQCADRVDMDKVET